jgi:hypothetical protein
MPEGKTESRCPVCNEPLAPGEGRFRAQQHDVHVGCYRRYLEQLYVEREEGPGRGGASA